MKHLVTLLLLLPSLALAEISFITLKHRNAEELIPLLEPVLDEGIRISGQGTNLIVNSKPWQLQEVERSVMRLDTPLRTFLISVTQEKQGERSGIHGDVSGTPEKPKLRLYGAHRKAEDSLKQQLRVIEGRWAFISNGTSIPTSTQQTQISRGLTTTSQSVQYQDVQSGFDVRPRIHGDTVTIEVRPFHARYSTNGKIEKQALSTTVSGRLGQWIEIGGAGEQEERSGSGTVYSTRKKRDATRSIKVKVELSSN